MRLFFMPYTKINAFENFHLNVLLLSFLFFFVSAAANAPAAGAGIRAFERPAENFQPPSTLSDASEKPAPKSTSGKAKKVKENYKNKENKNDGKGGGTYIELEEKPWFYHNDEFFVWNNQFSGMLSLAKPHYNLRADFRRDGSFKSKNSTGFGWYFRAGGRSESYFGFVQLDHSSDLRATGDLSYDIEFDGRKFKVYNGTADVHFSLKIDAFDFLIFKRIKNTAWGYFNFLYGVRAMQCELIVKDINSPVAASYSQVLPLPNLGFDARYDITERISAYGLISGLAVRKGDRGGRFNNFNLALEYDFKNEKKTGVSMAVAGGYRGQYIEANIDKNDYVVKHQGPYLKFLAKF